MIPMYILYCRIALFTVECTAMFTECGSVDLKHSAAWNKLLLKKNLFIKICRINCSKSALFTTKLILEVCNVINSFFKGTVSLHIIVPPIFCNKRCMSLKQKARADAGLQQKINRFTTVKWCLGAKKQVKQLRNRKMYVW